MSRLLLSISVFPDLYLKTPTSSRINSGLLKDSFTHSFIHLFIHTFTQFYIFIILVIVTDTVIHTTFAHFNKCTANSVQLRKSPFFNHHQLLPTFHIRLSLRPGINYPVGLIKVIRLRNPKCYREIRRHQFDSWLSKGSSKSSYPVNRLSIFE